MSDLLYHVTRCPDEACTACGGDVVALCGADLAGQRWTDGPEGGDALCVVCSALADGLGR